MLACLSNTAADSAAAESGKPGPSAAVPVRVAELLLRLHALSPAAATSAARARLRGAKRFSDNMEPISTQRSSKYRQEGGGAGRRRKGLCLVRCPTGLGDLVGTDA